MGDMALRTRGCQSEYIKCQVLLALGVDMCIYFLNNNNNNLLHGHI